MEFIVPAGRVGQRLSPLVNRYFMAVPADAPEAESRRLQSERRTPLHARAPFAPANAAAPFPALILDVYNMKVNDLISAASWTPRTSRSIASCLRFVPRASLLQLRTLSVGP